MQKLLRYALCWGGVILFYKANGQQRDTIGKVPLLPKDSTGVMVGKKQLKEVVVTGQKARVIEYQLDRIVLNANALVATAGGNVIDVLNTAPGVLIDENGSISMNGKEGVMVYIDDKPTYLAGADLINYLRSLPVSMIDKLELMPNPPARYNADGGAIINIRTKKIKLRGFNGNVALGAGYSRYFKTNNSLLFNYRNNDVNIYFRAGFTSNNGFFTSHRQRAYSYPDNSLTYTLLQDVNEVNKQPTGNYSMGLDYSLSKHTTVGLLYNGFVNPYSETGKYSNRFIGTTGKQDSSIISNSRFSSKAVRDAVNINVQHFFAGSHREININLDYLNYTNSASQRLESNVYLPVDTLVKQFALITESPYAAKIYGAKANYNDTILGNIKWEQGIQTIYSERNNTGRYFHETGIDVYTDPVLSNRFRYREHIHAAYITLEKHFRRLSVQTGLRVESTAGNALQYEMAFKPDTSFSIRYTNLFPTAYLLYKLDSNGKSTITFSAGKRIERPGYSELNPSAFYFDRNTTNTGNSLLQPAFSTNMELTYTYNRKFTAGISYSRTKNDITRGYKQVGDAFISMPVNIDLYTSLGASVNWIVNITPWWTFNLNQQVERRHYRGRIFNEGLYADEQLTTYFLKGYNQFKFRRGWSGDFTATFRSKLRTWQSDLRQLGQMNAGVQKKLNEKATVTFSGNDLFFTWKIRRDTEIQYAQIYYKLITDTQKFMVTFSYRFGKAFNSRERKTGIEAEAGRVY